ncbi:DUF1793-domain-containing protein [Lentinula aff. detonsa]|uniref:DUF1793-domain-containing protein n=1 Tax=Lentinula aff. detonsa TaxID=2804958 RepID=A0AA38NU65_9AGAR|nr:DUF1793-domain-containing protein [Lentinula aff. detonsa]
MIGSLMFIFFLLVLSISLVDSQFNSLRNFWPASYPLAVRAPYLNTWISTANGSDSLNFWPLHWDGSNIMGWSGFARIDGVTWQWMGASPIGNSTTLFNSEITPTSTKFSVIAGSVLLNLTFLSPIEPSDWVKQSLPFIYLSLQAESIDGQAHDVQVYSDISAEWISGNRNLVATWQTTQTSKSVYHRAQLQSPEYMTEINNIAEDSTVYYSMQTGSQVTYQTGQDSVVRGQFQSKGSLTNQQDTDFRAIDDDFVVLGISVDLGTNTNFATPVVWGLGLVRDPVIEYTTFASSSDIQTRSSYFWTEFDTIADAIDSFLADYPNAVDRANELDQEIMDAAQNVSSEYADLVAFGARQAMASSDITVAKNSDGTYNTSDVKAFQRDTGIGQRVNAVETLFATMPIYLYLNSSLLGIHLDSLLQYQSSGYSNAYAAPDLGISYPAATGDASDTHSKGIEDTGNMLIMTLAHAQTSGDGTLIKDYYNLLRSWADYLVSNTLYPNGQTSADGITKSNDTNLAIKGIIGIAAMAEISRAMGDTTAAQQYQANATSYVKLWESLATSSEHLLPTYEDTSSSDYALMYNMYADILLKTNLIDQNIYSSQASYYSNLTQSAGKFGLSYDNAGSNNEANSAWTLFTAGSIASVSSVTQNQLIEMVHTRAGFNQTTGDFPLIYDDQTGNSSTTSGLASPGQGAMFALLALNVANSSITIPASPSSSSRSLSAGAIAGAVVGSVLGVALLIGAGLFIWTRRRRRLQLSNDEDISFDRPPPRMPSNPNPQAYHDSTAAPIQQFTSEALYTYGDSKQRVASTIIQSPTGEGSESGYTVSSPMSQSALSRSTLARSETVQLRNDVENLRREMAVLRAAQPFDDAPPRYA